MVWSLSKDDDGLDSVHPLPTDARGVIVRGNDARPASPIRHVVPTVVVDPVSQVPQPPTSAAQRRAVEPTLVLKGRKLDEMRAQVAAQRSAHRRRKQMRLLTWAFAGGIALSLGWIVGLTLNFDASGQSTDSPGMGAPERGSAAENRPAGTAPNQTVTNTRDALVDAAPPSEADPRQDAEALHLADLPVEPDSSVETDSLGETGARDDTGRSDLAPTSADRGGSDERGADPETLTLDDLPFD